jgi:hypothetical protein
MINRSKIDKLKDIKEFDCPTDTNCFQEEVFDKQGRLVRFRLIPLNYLGKKTAYTEWTQYNDDGTIEKERKYFLKQKEPATE